MGVSCFLYYLVVLPWQKLEIAIYRGTKIIMQGNQGGNVGSFIIEIDLYEFSVKKSPGEGISFHRGYLTNQS